MPSPTARARRRRGRLRAFAGLLPALAALAVPAGAAADFPADARVERSAETGRATSVAMPPGRPDPRPQRLAAGAPPAEVGAAYLARHAADLGLDGPSGLRAIGTVAGPRGTTSIRYQQTIKGVEVLGGQFAVRLDAGRNVVSLNGEASPAGDDFDATPAIGRGAAERAALAAVAKHERVRAATLRAGAAPLRVLDPRVLGGPGLRRASLVYAVRVRSARDAELRRLVLVDARRGHAAVTIDEAPEARQRQICDGANVRGAGVPCTTPVLREGGTYGGPAADVKPAYDYSGAHYGFFKTRFNRDSLDGKGFTLKSTVRYCPPEAERSCPHANASWNGEQMIYGDTFASADDAVGHELSHGLDFFTSNLFYYYQSGAIDESLADVYGELIDQRTASPNDTAADRWKLGESLPIGAIRDLRDPAEFEDPDRMGSPLYLTGEDDSGGVHTNSGVNNKAAFLMTDGGTFNGRTVTGLGLEKVARLYYTVQTQYLTSGSDFKDLGLALGTACDALVGTAGFTAANCVEVRDAVAATEMVADERTAVEQPACATAGQHPRYVAFDDFEGATEGWASAPVAGGDSVWEYAGGYAHSGDVVLYGWNADTVTDSAMTMKTGVAIPANAFLRLHHAYEFEEDWTAFYDGGVIEYSVAGGAWTPLDAPGYDGAIDGEGDNPLGEREAYVGVSSGFIAESIPLGALAGKTVRFRFRVGTDSLVSDLGWIVDDVGIHTCGADTTPPATTLTAGPAEGSFKNTTTASFSFTAGEKGSRFECKLDAAPYAPCRSPEPVGPLAGGAHTFQVRAVDPAGLRDATPSIRRWTVDTAKPVVTISAPAAGAKVYDTTPSFAFAAGEPATFSCFLDGVLRQAGCASGWTPGAALTQGAHTFRVDAKDRAGNVGTLSRSFAVAARFSIDPASAASEGAGADQIVVRRAGGNGSASVKVATTLAGTAKSPADFAARTGVTVTFGGTEEVKTVPLTVVDDAAAEGTETIGVTLSAPVGAELPTASGLVNLADDD